MKQAHKKWSPRATANSPLGLPDMGKIYFINLKNMPKELIIFLKYSVFHFLNATI